MTDGVPVRLADLFAAALGGVPCHVVGLYESVATLPVAGWRRLTGADRALLARCRGATLDVGCGPGRMSARLAELGHVALGIDLVAAAVTEARDRGATALRRDVFGPLPAEGRWDTILLADGNIGIGGDPAALLGRLAELLSPGGRVVCDLGPPGTGLRTRAVHLECDGMRSPPFSWTIVGPEAMPDLAPEAGFTVAETGRASERWLAVLTR